MSTLRGSQSQVDSHAAAAVVAVAVAFRAVVAVAFVADEEHFVFVALASAAHSASLRGLCNALVHL